MTCGTVLQLQLKCTPKMNNSAEGWHTGFETTSEHIHPHIFNFIEAILREQLLVQANTEQVIAGNPFSKEEEDLQGLRGTTTRTCKALPGQY
mgnify:CR=1 FL=1